MSKEQTIARRQRRIAARRTQILDAAAQVFAEKGFHRATTKEIAEAADVSEGTIYNYFDAKADLLIGIMTRIAEGMGIDALLEQALVDDPREALTSLLHFRQTLVRERYQMLQAVMSELIINEELSRRYYQQLVLPATQMLEQHLQARVERGQIRPINTQLFARVLIVINIGLFLGLLMGDPVVEAEWENLAGVLVGILFDGIHPSGEE
jgi:AcrR family transcriptional regulator